MKVIKAEHECTAVKKEQYVTGDLPEAAFVGRSNVGKSSMINSLCNRKNMARVGQTPGKTRVINFYNVNDAIRLVDLPGYGYAKVSKAEKKSWGNLADTYLKSRDQLKLIIQLIDIRHKPTRDDIAMVNWLKTSDIPFVICAVKSDKLSKNKGINSARQIIKTLELHPDTPFVIYSSEKRKGIDELWEVIDYFLGIEESE